ncbi:MAG: hypothetical protein AAGE52_33095 [Myxococcota bacterium]
MAIGVFALICGMFWMARSAEHEEPEAPGRHEVVPLGRAQSKVPRFDPNQPLPPPPFEEPQAEPSQEEPDREAEAQDMNRLVEAMTGGPQEFEEAELREAIAEPIDRTDIPEVPGLPRGSIQRTMVIRREQSLDLVETLLTRVGDEIEAAEGDPEHLEWLRNSHRRLEVRRAALIRSIDELEADTPDTP